MAAKDPLLFTKVHRSLLSFLAKSFAAFNEARRTRTSKIHSRWCFLRKVSLSLSLIFAPKFRENPNKIKHELIICKCVCTKLMQNICHIIKIKIGCSIFFKAMVAYLFLIKRSCPGIFVFY